jgi:hypothetical protein
MLPRLYVERTALASPPAANRLTSVGGVSYTWDDNGNLAHNKYVYLRARRYSPYLAGSPYAETRSADERPS